MTEERLEAAMTRYGASVYRLAFAQSGSRADADDVYQEVFLRYWRTSPDLASDEHEKAWLLRVTVNCARSLHRARVRRATVELIEDIPDRRDEEAQAADELRDLLARLPETYRAVIHLHYFEELSTAEIAKTLGRREGTVRMQLTRARRMLHDRLTDISDEREVVK
ncbi:MAG: sigma-70 family RNA polymerase sigma factor [Clostridia bacterium]|nr:sigma-70 family RNA polymerase sigma factor [Clostridia bacterium]